MVFTCGAIPLFSAQTKQVVFYHIGLHCAFHRTLVSLLPFSPAIQFPSLTVLI